MRPPIKDGNILLTGASSGIGRAMAYELASEAKSIVLVARRKSRLEELKEALLAKHPKLQVLVKPCDLSDIEKVGALLDELEEELESIDILINNAGLGDICALELSEWEKLDRMIKLNVTALTYMTRRVVGPMRERGKGGILNISSGFGLTFMPGVASYAGTKHYVTAFNECLRCELAGTGVVVTQICPGPVDTEFEAVAGNPTGQEVPGFVLISAEHCARASLRAFRRGRALSTPGFVAWLLITLGATTPRFVLRFIYGFLGKALVKRQLRAQNDAPAAEES